MGRKKKVTKEELLKEVDDLGIDIGQNEDELTVEQLQEILAKKKEELGITASKTVKADLPETTEKKEEDEQEVVPSKLVTLDELRKYEQDGLLKTVQQVGQKFKITLITGEK